MDQLTQIKLIVKEPGVVDLPMRIRAPFAQALRAERMGDFEEAEAKLNLAIEREESLT